MVNNSTRVGLIVSKLQHHYGNRDPRHAARRAGCTDERYTFHSSRMRMKQVTREELAHMDAESDRCAAELADARCDVMAYACLVAIMAQGAGYHCQAQDRLAGSSSENSAEPPVVTSAGALLPESMRSAQESRRRRAVYEAAH